MQWGLIYAMDVHKFDEGLKYCNTIILSTVSKPSQSLPTKLGCTYNKKAFFYPLWQHETKALYMPNYNSCYLKFFAPKYVVTTRAKALNVISGPKKCTIFRAHPFKFHL